MHRPYQLIRVCLLLVLIAGCGFRLRGSVDIPPSLAIVYLDYDTSGVGVPSEFPAVFKRKLETNGSTVTTDPAAATATVALLGERVEQRTTGTTADDEVRSFTMTLRVRYSVTLADGTEIIEPEWVTNSQDFIYREADILGRAEGERLVLQDMREDAATSILQRIQAVVG